MFLFTKVSFSDIFAVGLIPFMASIASVMGKIMLQAFRFKYFINEFIGRDVSSTSSIISARLAGEFVTQTTPSYVGGELVRVAFLTKNGVPVGRSAWVTTLEIIADVFVGTMLAFVAGAVAIYNGGDFIGIAVILIAIPTLAFWLSLVIFSAKRNLQLPSFSKKILRKLISKEKADRMIDSTDAAIADLCKMSRENFNSMKAVKVFAVGIALTFAAFCTSGSIVHGTGKFSRISYWFVWIIISNFGLYRVINTTHYNRWFWLSRTRDLGIYFESKWHSVYPKCG